MKREFKSVTGTGNILNISLGFKPDRVVITNSNDMNSMEMVAYEGTEKFAHLTTASTGAVTDEASGISFYDGDEDSPAGITLAATGTCTVNTAHTLYIVAELFN